MTRHRVAVAATACCCRVLLKFVDLLLLLPLAVAASCCCTWCCLLLYCGVGVVDMKRKVASKSRFLHAATCVGVPVCPTVATCFQERHHHEYLSFGIWIIYSSALLRLVRYDRASKSPKSQLKGTTNQPSQVYCIPNYTESNASLILRVSNHVWRMASVCLWKMMKQGWKMTVDDRKIVIIGTNNKSTLTFDIKIQTKNGTSYCAYLKRRSARHFRRRRGEPCQACSIGQGVRRICKDKESEPDTIIEGRILLLDIAAIKAKKGMPRLSKPRRRMMVDERTGLKLPEFFPKKSDIPNKKLRLGNEGENKSLQRRAERADWTLGLYVEFTAPNTPQQNSNVQTGFAVVANRGQAAMAACSHIMIEFVERSSRQILNLMTGRPTQSIVRPSHVTNIGKARIQSLLSTLLESRNGGSHLSKPRAMIEELPVFTLDQQSITQQTCT